MDHSAPSTPGPRQQRLLQVLGKAGRELSAQDLHQLLRGGRERQGLATVYRGLKLLQRAGLVRCRNLTSGESVYAPLERDEHHLICVHCGWTEALRFCPLRAGDLETNRVLLQGFRPLFHTFDIHGLCVCCQQIEAAGHG